MHDHTSLLEGLGGLLGDTVRRAKNNTLGRQRELLLLKKTARGRNAGAHIYLHLPPRTNGRHLNTIYPDTLAHRR
eukprot:9134013-Pyramimonas_sp.AAC.1